MERLANINTTVSFPNVEKDSDLSIRRDLPRFENGLHAILQKHGLNGAAVSVLGGEGGSMPVFAVGDDLVLKLFPDIRRTNFEAEVVALRLLAGETQCRVPQLKHHGSLESWHYVIMTRVGGVQLSSIWKSLDERQKEIVCERLGAMVTDLHRVGTSSASDSAAWSAFIDEQARGCVERQRAHGLREELLEQIPEFIRPVLESIKSAPTVFLHTELMQEHVFVDPERLTIEGLIDFEPSMRGSADYEFGAFVIFIAQAQPQLLRAFLRGYGYEWNRKDISFSSVVMTCTLLHRYSRLTWYLDRLEGPRGREIVDLEEIARKWFALPRVAGT